MTAWRAVARELRRYEYAVVAACDRDGHPVSVRCVPVPDERTLTFTVPFPDALGVAAGPAWLLCHFHDEKFWSLRSFGARGSLERTPEGWRFRPTSFVPGVGGIIPMVKLFVGGRRRALRYLAVRGIAPPEVPWDRISAIKRQMKAERAAGSPRP